MPLRQQQWLLGVILLLIGCVSLEEAYAATYKVYSCKTSTGSAVGSTGWDRAVETTDPTARTYVECERGGPTFETDMSGGHSRGLELGLQWTAAPNTAVVGARFAQNVYMPGAPSIWGWQYQVGAIDAFTGKRFDYASCLSPDTACAGYVTYEGEGNG